LILLVVVGNSVLLQDADSTRISSISSLRIGTHFGNSPELWLNPQQDYDL
jgi:plasmid maintenance system antidote protein VapI